MTQRYHGQGGLHAWAFKHEAYRAFGYQLAQGLRAMQYPASPHGLAALRVVAAALLVTG
jgi:hypothetical protein